MALILALTIQILHCQFEMIFLYFHGVREMDYRMFAVRRSNRKQIVKMGRMFMDHI